MLVVRRAGKEHGGAEKAPTGKKRHGAACEGTSARRASARPPAASGGPRRARLPRGDRRRGVGAHLHELELVEPGPQVMVEDGLHLLGDRRDVFVDGRHLAASEATCARRRCLAAGLEAPRSLDRARARGAALRGMTTLGCTFPRHVADFFRDAGNLEILAQRSATPPHHTARHPTAVDHVRLPPSRRRPRCEGRAPHHSRRRPRVAARRRRRAPRRARPDARRCACTPASSACRHRRAMRVPTSRRRSLTLPLASASQASAVSPTSPTTTSSRCALRPRRRPTRGPLDRRASA